MEILTSIKFFRSNKFGYNIFKCEGQMRKKILKKCETPEGVNMKSEMANVTQD